MSCRNRFSGIMGSAVLLLLALGSCQRLYVPNRCNVPLLRERNELRASLNLRNAQLAYAPLQGLAVMANGFSRQAETTEYDYCLILCPQNRSYQKRKGEQRFLEAGVGYFKPLGEAFVFELFGGYGRGSTGIGTKVYDEATDTFLSSRAFNARQKRLFIQSDLGLGNENFQAGLSARLSSVRFPAVTLSGYSPAEAQAEHLHTLTDQRILVAEPAVTSRFGYKWIMLEGQAGMLLPQKKQQELVRPGFFVNFSLCLSLAPRFRKAGAPEISNQQQP